MLEGCRKVPQLKNRIVNRATGAVLSSDECAGSLGFLDYYRIMDLLGDLSGSPYAPCRCRLCSISAEKHAQCPINLGNRRRRDIPNLFQRTTNRRDSVVDSSDRSERFGSRRRKQRREIRIRPSIGNLQTFRRKTFDLFPFLERATKPNLCVNYRELVPRMFDGCKVLRAFQRL
jgi:hypothetical protein